MLANVKSAFELYCNVIQNTLQNRMSKRRVEEVEQGGLSKTLTQSLVEMATFTAEAIADAIDDDDARHNELEACRE